MGDTPGKQRPKLRDIADATGLSLAAVSLALNGKAGVSAENRRRVVAAARGLNYERPSPRGTPPTISVIIERLPVAIAKDPFNRPILEGLEAAARPLGYRVAMEFVGPEDLPDAAPWARSGATAGAIILGGGDLSPRWVEAAAAAPLPVVMLDHVVPGLDLPAVVSDNLGGAHAMTSYLLAMGHRRIGYIRGPSKYWTLSERLAGFLLALQQHGVWPDAELIPPRVSHAEEKGYHEMRRLLDLPEPPTAVLAVSDKAAVGAYRAAQERGLAIPRDISIAGFDDIETGRALNPPLTTVHVPGDEMGRVAFERLRLLMAGDEAHLARQIKWTIPTSLVIRGSVAHREAAMAHP
jgi:LacI family transcriptional regulator